MKNNNITELEHYTKQIGNSFQTMLFHYYKIEDPKRKKTLFYEILAYVRKLLMKDTKE
jgi:hypothetical protein